MLILLCYTTQNEIQYLTLKNISKIPNLICLTYPITKIESLPVMLVSRTKLALKDKYDVSCHL